MAEKILALIVAFLGGVAFMALVFSKLINITIRYSPATRKTIRDALDREDARHAIVGSPRPVDFVAESFLLGTEAAEAMIEEERGEPCELCLDPPLAEHTVSLDGRTLRVCEGHAEWCGRRKQ